MHSFLVIILCSLLFAYPITYIPPHHSEQPAFLEFGSFAQYKQEFSTGDTYELRWEITAIDGKRAEITTQSHGLVFNTTTDIFDIVPGGGILVIDLDTWVIHEAFYTNGTEIEGYPVGDKMAFWISPETNESTHINTLYESNECPTLTEPLNFECLSTPRRCWMTHNVYSFGNQMDRYYDQLTGIVLMIETQRTISSRETSVLETLNSTNIAPLLEESFVPDLFFLTVTSVAALALSSIAIVVIVQRRRQNWPQTSGGETH